MTQRIERHGLQLLAIFPNATQRDPVKLCKALRRNETIAHRHAEMACNGEYQSEESQDRAAQQIIRPVRALLGDTGERVWINGDPRGYALKIDLRPGEELHRDWGNYGIIAPDLA
jgi:hypothetical protein